MKKGRTTSTDNSKTDRHETSDGRKGRTPLTIDWAAVAGALFRGVGLPLLVELGKSIADGAPAIEDDEGDTPIDDDEAPARRAAALLGVRLDATPDEVRAALRRKLAMGRLHPDQGGDGEEATRLIAAKNLLLEHARREVQP